MFERCYLRNREYKQQLSYLPKLQVRSPPTQASVKREGIYGVSASQVQDKTLR
jgi:hypothetical protein